MHSLTQKIINDAHPWGDFNKVDSIILQWLEQKVNLHKDRKNLRQLFGLSESEVKEKYPYNPDLYDKDSHDQSIHATPGTRCPLCRPVEDSKMNDTKTLEIETRKVFKEWLINLTDADIDRIVGVPKVLKERLVEKIESVSTHMLWYHDKEGRTTSEQVIPKARFGEIADLAISFLESEGWHR